MRFSSVTAIAIFAFSHQVCATSLAASAPQPDIILSAHLGPYPVSIYEHEIRTSRLDPLAPTKQNRRLMITVYRPFLDNLTCPIEHQSHIQYAPTVAVAAILEGLGLNLSSPDASSAFDAVKLVNCSRPVPSSSPSGPLLLFSHGYGGTHHFYASITQAAASSGYTVVSIDHTWESAAIVFPDGFVAYPSNITNKYRETPEGENFLQTMRMNDSISVLDAIERGVVPGLGQYSNASSGKGSGAQLASTSTSSSSSASSSSPPHKPLRAVMYGHSFGGTAAMNVAAIDKRVIAAANIDGPIRDGPIANGTVRKPLLLMDSASREVSYVWPAWYAKQVLDWKTWVRPKNTVHYGYTDLPLLADLLGLRGVIVPEELTGTIDGRRFQEIVWRYTVQFFDFILKEGKNDLLTAKSGEFPDIEFVGHAEVRKRK